MEKLTLLFTKNGLQWQIANAKKVLEAESHFLEEDQYLNFLEDKLEKVLLKKNIKSIEVYSSINHFSITADDFTNHDLGYKLIEYNSPIDPAKEELMLSINKKFGVQFYYTLPKYFYNRIKETKLPTRFSFTGDFFLNYVDTKFAKEVHINLYHHHVEFFALKSKQLILYNNLDADSEVDFLYFIMFSINKLDFSLADTHFYLYGESTINETFVSELSKFTPNLSISTKKKSQNTIFFTK